MRSTWSGALGFGLVSIPVKMGKAVEDKSVSFRQVHAEDGGRVKYVKVCAEDGKELVSGEIIKAYEADPDTLVPLEDSELRALPLPTEKTMEISGMIAVAAIDELQLGDPYYLAPSNAVANKPYVLLREALARSGRAAVGKFAARGRERLVVIHPHGEVLLARVLHWPDEIRSADGIAPSGRIKITEEELDRADDLIQAMGEADLDSYHDEYREALEQLVAAKLQSGGVPRAEDGTAEPAPVIDLLAALEASIEATGRRTGTRTGAKKTAKRTPKKTASATTGHGARKSTAKRHLAAVPESSGSGKSTGTKKSTATTAKKTSAAKTASKKTTAKKTTAKKPTGTKSAARKTG